jgi:hypothetical protein
LRFHFSGIELHVFCVQAVLTDERAIVKWLPGNAGPLDLSGHPGPTVPPVHLSPTGPKLTPVRSVAVFRRKQNTYLSWQRLPSRGCGWRIAALPGSER